MTQHFNVKMSEFEFQKYLEDKIQKMNQLEMEKQLEIEKQLHITVDETNVSNNTDDDDRKKCINEICLKYPTFNYSGKKKGIYCYEHRLLNMTNVIQKRCETHLCDMIISSKYKGYCFYCYSNMFPEKCINYKNKECRVVDFVKNNFDNLTWVYDKKIQDGCSTRRPDLFLDLGYQIIIIEIDENQHLNYESICENKRIMLLSQDVNHRPIIFLRFNPDDYIKDGCKIPSCWTTTKSKGFIKLKNEFEWNNRLEVLKNEIILWINPSNKIDKIIHIIELFFDS